MDMETVPEEDLDSAREIGKIVYDVLLNSEANISVNPGYETLLGEW